MRILVVTPWFPHAAEDQEGSFVLDSVRALAGVGHAVHVLVTRPRVPGWLARHASAPPSGTAPLRESGFTVSAASHWSVPRNRLRWLSNRMYLAGCGPAVREAIASFRPDVIHAHTEAGAVLACDARQSLSLAVAATIHGINRDPRFLRGAGQPAYLRRAFREPERIVLVGEPLRAYAHACGAADAAIAVVPNGFRAEGAQPWRTRRILTGEMLRFISVSNLVEGKGVDRNLEALALAQSRGLAAWRYDVVGEGPLRAALEQQARTLGVAPHVHFHGRLPHAQVMRMLGQCDVFTLPSAPEAFGIAYLEAMACGLLAIGCAGEGPSAFIAHGHTGYLVDAAGTDALAALFGRLAENRDESARVAAAGRDAAWAHWTWAAHGQKLTRVLESAIARRSQPSGGAS